MGVNHFTKPGIHGIEDVRSFENEVDHQRMQTDVNICADLLESIETKQTLLDPKPGYVPGY